MAAQSSSSGTRPADSLALTEPGTVLVGRLEREMGKTQGMREGLWLTGLSRWAVSLFLVFLQ